ncbi:predicted protein [Naegleria gruberi]|uniref:glycine--tRNA ligase n=1 Tax=Naegleria gruberi TaxID=5762 RepID=D2V7H3_NAEGR|nr:uncharacterized protein NAEGRDRAFT_64802 [Naegleria gruberi]EFC47251.1 predicted protein [Naegleria gruberi]|eukprot:XP_002679995.1 predicted protein [Naegleria gruberi strain NEG-M]
MMQQSKRLVKNKQLANHHLFANGLINSSTNSTIRKFNNCKFNHSEKKKETPSTSDDYHPSLNDFVAFCKRRGFAYQGSSLYGGLSGSFDYGTIGAQLKKNLKDLWWKDFVELRRDCVGIDTPIILHSKVWEKSGHIGNFTDPMVTCLSCHSRFEVENLLKRQQNPETKPTIDKMETAKEKIEWMNQNSSQVTCPCEKKANSWDKIRNFDMLFKTMYGPIEKEENTAYLRPETAQGIFINFNNVITTSRKRLPLGVGQIGKAFRNEISPRDFIFRQREFEQMELEYFCHPTQSSDYFKYWVNFCHEWLLKYGLKKDNVRIYTKTQDLAHYSKETSDIEYLFPFGWSEIWGIANRTDYDLQAHVQPSKKDKHTFEYVDPQTNEKYVPHVVEPSAGADRVLFAFLYDAYNVEEVPGEEKRVVLKIHPDLAPYKFAVFPLQKKPVELMSKAEEIYSQLASVVSTDYDVSSSIGVLYRRHDEIGTPYCITIDHQTLKDNTVTVRDRDTMKQIRMNINDIVTNPLHLLKNNPFN